MYAIVFTVAISLSLSSFCVIRLVSGHPICSNNLFKFPQHRNYEILPTQAETNIDTEVELKSIDVEPFSGWRFRAGFLLNIVFLALLTIHTIITLENGATLLRIVFIVYWVCSCLFTSNQRELHYYTTAFVLFRHLTDGFSTIPLLLSASFPSSTIFMSIFFPYSTWTPSDSLRQWEQM